MVLMLHVAIPVTEITMQPFTEGSGRGQSRQCHFKNKKCNKGLHAAPHITLVMEQMEQGEPLPSTLPAARVVLHVYVKRYVPCIQACLCVLMSVHQCRGSKCHRIQLHRDKRQ